MKDGESEEDSISDFEREMMKPERNDGEVEDDEEEEEENGEVHGYDEEF
jgi:hypothetical protein